jgi:dipeptidase
LTATGRWSISAVVGCDTLVALPPASADRSTLFAKNSDRPPREAQRIVHHSRREHPGGARVRCQYVEIPQVAETAAWLGSQPHWLWGVEHGVNEHRVAIGNETVFAREAPAESGLLGMDLVRLGLERARTADEALAVITELIEEHGQGGSGFAHLHWPYNNAFLVADPERAWILETSNRHWAAEPIREIGNISNGLAIGTGWERGASDLTSYAVSQGWWRADAGKVDFAAAYADESGVPPNLSSARRARGRALLDAGRGRLSVTRMREVLRDHYDGGGVYRRRAVDDPEFFSLCMHADPLDNTTAAMVAPLGPRTSPPTAAWVCLGSPCVGVFLPCYVEGRLPAALGVAGAEPDDESPWWRMRERLSLVERDFAGLVPRVRAAFDELEARFAREAAGAEAEADSLRRAGKAAAAANVLSGLTERATSAWLARTSELVREIREGS